MALMSFSWAAFAQPANDLCANAIAVTAPSTTPGTTVNATTDGAGTCNTSNTAPGVWYTLTPAITGTVQINLCGSPYDTKLSVYTGACAGPLTCVAGNDDFCGLQSQVTISVTAGTTYRILVHGFGSATGTFTLTVGTIVPAVANNDACTGAIALACGQPVTGTTVGATADAVPTCVTGLSTAPGVWYSFAGTGDLVTASLCGSAFDTKIGVFSGTCGALTCVTGNDDFCGLQSQVTFTSVPGTTYFVLVTGFSANAGAFTLSVNCVPPAPGSICTTALPLACGPNVTGSTAGGTVAAGLPFCGTTLTSARGIWYVLPGTGNDFTLSTCNPGTNFDTKLGVFSGSCGALTCVVGNDDDFACGFSIVRSTVSFSTTLGVNYYVFVTGFGTNTGNYELSVQCCAPPLAVCLPNQTIVLDNATPVTIDVDGGSTADCGVESIVQSAVNFDCFDTGANVVTLTVTDVNGLTSSCTTTVTIISTFVATEVGCIGDVNVTLGADCSARITPGMVLTGNNLACAGNVNVTVDGTTSDVISGCGPHTYSVEILEPVGTITEFRNSDWVLTQDLGNGGCAAEFAITTLTPAAIDLSIRYGEEVAAAFTAPYDGIVSFDYDFNGADQFFDFLIIDVNGTELVNQSMAGTGTVNQVLMAGQTALVRIEDDDFCGIPAGSTDVTLTAFSFSSMEQVVAYTCWGNILAEDKTAPDVVCPANTSSITRNYAAQIATGRLEATDPLLNLNNYSCFTDIA
ncbi:MAG: hypothetical protein DA408_16270, partial [Bacteroidetes bacterium]